MEREDIMELVMWRMKTGRQRMLKPWHLLIWMACLFVAVMTLGVGSPALLSSWDPLGVTILGPHYLAAHLLLYLLTVTQSSGNVGAGVSRYMPGGVRDKTHPSPHLSICGIAALVGATLLSVASGSVIGSYHHFSATSMMTLAAYCLGSYIYILFLVFTTWRGQ